MKKFWKILIICAVALGVMAVTCPGKQRHVDAGVKYMRNLSRNTTTHIEKAGISTSLLSSFPLKIKRPPHRFLRCCFGR